MNTEVEEVISILQNPEKMEELILKLKTGGKNSPQLQNFKHCIDSFHLNKTPRGIHEKNILQSVFKYSNPRECFKSFRLVCKSWQSAVETIRLDSDQFDDTLLEELCDHERNGQFPTFYSKYIRIYKSMFLDFDTGFDETKWHSISKFLSTNIIKLQCLVIRASDIPPKMTFFLFNVFQNSQFTLKTLEFGTSKVICFPTISLPNLTDISMFIGSDHDDEIDEFDYFMRSFVDSDTMCKDLKIFELTVRRNIQILKYITKNYSNHFVCAPGISTLEHIPLKISHLKLENLAACRYISQVEYLILHVQHLSAQFAGGWDNYKEILSFCPNLKGITFLYKSAYTNLLPHLSSLSSRNQNIWKQRISYFKSQNIKILTGEKYEKILCELRNLSTKSWTFDFDLVV